MEIIGIAKIITLYIYIHFYIPIEHSFHLIMKLISTQLLYLFLSVLLYYNFCLQAHMHQTINHSSLCLFHSHTKIPGLDDTDLPQLLSGIGVI